MDEAFETLRAEAAKLAGQYADGLKGAVRLDQHGQLPAMRMSFESGFAAGFAYLILGPSKSAELMEDAMAGAIRALREQN